MNKFISFGAVFVAVVFIGCSSPNRINLISKQEQNVTKQVKKQDQILDINKTNTVNNKVDFLLLQNKFLKSRAGGDCSGFVLEVNKFFNNKFLNTQELVKFYDKSSRRSQAMYNMLKAKKMLSNSGNIGSLVFFKNTTEKLKNSKSTNITHLGIVVGITDNTYKIMHLSNDSVKIDYMNLIYKNLHKLNGKTINSFIIRNCKGSKCLLSNRFVSFGKFIFN